ncbi:MAG: hypothetical protein PHX60_03700 [Giesbergeria sp.]|uniref:hypothetical protein n=1 Tax=Giesbergeria sp. TaxID=2818473 RepID=UPI00260C9DF9|nr:hypothetical protein [Giesbergeria sp.]MDD2608785.1 hypothetical protein [Giesbergeria sp.]
MRPSVGQSEFFACGYQGPPDDTARVAFLFARYQALTAAIAPVLPVKPTRRRKA